jgi:hypothetical protein
MDLPEQHTRIVAADPIEVGTVRLLPSVLVNSRAQTWPGRGFFRTVRLRPVSVVVESAEGARWYEIPNAESEAISTMLAAAGGIAAVSVLILLITRLIRHS